MRTRVTKLVAALVLTLFPAIGYAQDEGGADAAPAREVGNVRVESSNLGSSAYGLYGAPLYGGPPIAPTLVNIGNPLSTLANSPLALPERRYLPFDLLNTQTIGAQQVSGVLQPGQLAGYLSEVQQAMRFYGDFTRRPAYGQPGTAADLLARKDLLLQATSFNAPVYRSDFKRAAPTGPVITETQPGVAPGTQVPTAAAREPLPLEEQLALRLETARRKARSDGWVALADARYRDAAWYFRSAIAMNEIDLESRVGEVFALAAQEQWRSASAALRETMDRVDNPFAITLPMEARFGSPTEARRMIGVIEQYAQQHREDGDALALQAFLAWYLGDRDGALAMARALSRIPGSEPFAHWPEQMTASTSSSGESPSP